MGEHHKTVSIEFFPLPDHAMTQGAVLDLRARLAIDFINSALHDNPIYESHELAESACMVAEQVVAEFRKRGWIAPVPVDNHVSPELRAHIQRNARMQVISQTAMQRAVDEEASRVAKMSQVLAQVMPPGVRN